MFNLMMVGEESFWNEKRSVVWEKKRFLGFTDQDIVRDVASLHEKALDKIKNIPTLFMYEFSFSARDGIGAKHSRARVGWISGIQDQRDKLLVSFEFDAKIPPLDSQKLSECWEKLDINVRMNECYRTHWAIKNVDLLSVLRSAGLIDTKPALNSPSGSAEDVDVNQEPHEAVQTDSRQYEGKPRIFIVHGRDDGIKNEVARWVSKIGVEEVILHEQVSRGRSILEKFRDNAKNVEYAIVIATPDDVGGLIGGPQNKRARQNVIFELGFFLGALGPGRVALIRCGSDMEIPSDYSGIVMFDYDPRGAWKVDLAKELVELAVPFDFKSILR